jgi:NAD(P)-dependent dehydrogenase (short-subunit alcohol dehydrogenase family)
MNSASQSGHRLGALTAEQDAALAVTPADELLALAMLQPDEVTDSLHAYQLARRGNSLRVKAQAVRWAERDAQINTISPGSTSPFTNEQLVGEALEPVRDQIVIATKFGFGQGPVHRADPRHPQPPRPHREHRGHRPDLTPADLSDFATAVDDIELVGARGTGHEQHG